MMRIKTNFIFSPFLLSLLIGLSACGGGGGGDDDGGGDTPQNSSPIANAGTDKSAESGSNITLDGSGSTDSDGSIASYNWVQTSGSDITLLNANQETLSFTVTVETDTEFTFSLTVTDDDGATATDEVVLTVTAPISTSLTSTLDSPWTIQDNRTLNFNKVVFTGSKYIAVGNNIIAESTDGSSWTKKDISYNIDFNGLAVNGNNAVAIPNTQLRYPGVAITSDGSNWQVVGNIETADCSGIKSISHNGTQFIGLFGNNAICTSTDGSSWQIQSTQQTPITKLVAGLGKYAALISSGLITLESLTSTAITSPSLPNSSSGDFSNLIFGNNVFVGIRSGDIIYSSNATDWLAVSGSVIPDDVRSVTYSSSQGFIAISSDGHPDYKKNIYSSTDGITWSLKNSSNLPIFTCSHEGSCSVINGSNETLLVSTREDFYTSSDQISWNKTSSDNVDVSVRSSFTYNGALYAANAQGHFITSTDNGANWSVVSSSLNFIRWVFHDGVQFIAQTSSGGSSAPGISYSDDGVNWTTAITYGSNYVYGASVKVGTTTYNFVTSGNANEDRNKILFSDDGISYQVDDSLNAITSSVSFIRQAVTNGTDIVARSDNAIYTNVSGNWALATSATNLKDIVWTGTHFVAAGASGLIMTSTDGSTWITRTWLNTTYTITDILVAGSTVFATDSGGEVATSSDHGITWVSSKNFLTGSSTASTITELAYDGTTVYGFGSNAGGLNVTSVSTADNGANWDIKTVQGTVVNGHVIYDTGSRFVTLNQESTADINTGAISWSATSTPLPDDSSFAYIATQATLADITLDRINHVSGSTDSYTSGNAGYSEDGKNWIIKTGLVKYHFQDYTPASGIFVQLGSGRQVQTSSDGINFIDATVIGLVSDNLRFNTVKYVNGEYIGINIHKTTGIPGVYTSSDGSNWTLKTETDLGLGAFNDFGRYSTIFDIEYDGAQYLMAYTDVNSSTRFIKGVMVLTTSDLITFALHETAVKILGGINFEIDSSGYKIEGNNFVATHAAY